MLVEVETFLATSSVDPTRTVKPKLWRVRVDGHHAGFIGWKPGSKFMPYMRFSPAELRQVEDEISRQIAELTGEAAVPVESIPTPKPIPAYLSHEDNGADDDDFDSAGFTG